MNPWREAGDFYKLNKDKALIIKRVLLLYVSL